MSILCLEPSKEVYLGDFVIEGLHMSILSLELIDDTVYQVSFYEKSPYADCWDLYKEPVYKLRDKYAHFDDVTEPIVTDRDSVVTFYKTDGITQILFTAYPKSLSLTITSEHFHNIWGKRLADEFTNTFLGKTGPNYDEKNKVTSSAGVRFGETRANTINAFKQRGTFVKNEGQLSYFSNVSFGGGTYNLATLYFQYDSRRYETVLAAARFEKNFYEWRKEEALMMYEAVVSKFQEKYTNCLVLKDEADSKAMVCGMLEDEYEGGNLPPIVVTFELGVSRGGDKFYYVTVSYFGKRMNSVASDDI